MGRLLTLWLTLLGAAWLARAAVSALLFERVEAGAGALLPAAAVALAQAAALAWLTRDPPPPAAEPGLDPASGLDREGD